MNRFLTIFAASLVAAALNGGGGAARAQDVPQAPPRISQMGLGEVTPTRALVSTCEKSNQLDSLNRFVDSINEHLLVSFQQTRKFDVVARADLAQLIREQQLPEGVVTDSQEKALPGKIKRLDYLLVTSVTDFKDEKEGMFIEGIGTRVDTRVVQATAQVKVFNTSTGSLLHSVTVPVVLDERGVHRVPREAYGNRAVDDSLIEAVATETAVRAAQRVVDSLYPARVLAVTDGIVTINRGEGSGVAPGQPWDILALGKDMVDPDTGVSLGHEEVQVGEMVITDVLPKFSKGRLTGDDRGVAPGAVVRPKLVAPGPRGFSGGGNRPLPPAPPPPVGQDR